MKFSHTLSLNANPDWADHYIDYASLKKVINEVESSITTTTTKGDQKLLSSEKEQEEERCREIFLKKLTKMVQGVRDFYDKKRAELDSNLAMLQPILEKSSSQDKLDLLADETKLTPLKSVNSVAQLSGIDGGGGGIENNMKFQNHRREICDLFTQYHALRKYADLNCTAVRKIMKKYDKAMGDNIKETHLASLKLLLPFWDNITPELNSSMGTLQRYFAHFYCEDDYDEALKQLTLMVREVITYQRRTVWLDVIKDQRENENAQIIISGTDSVRGDGDGHGHPQDQHSKPILLLAKRILIQKIMSDISIQIGLVATILFILILTLPGIFDNDPTKRNCLALFVYVSILWAAETLPLFCTSMLVPFLTVVLRVVVVDGIRLDAHAASKHAFDSMFSHVIMLLLGGFSIAAALSKHNIAQVIAISISRRCGSNIRKVLLVNMFIATIASMWISNVAAPVLCYSLIAPILKAATAGTKLSIFGNDQRLQSEYDRRLCRALVMGIALASNVGGMASPISSPQNLFALEYTPIGWIAWFTVSIPLCSLMNVVLWIWLIVCFQLPENTNSAAVMHTLNKNNNSHDEPFTQTQHYVIAVSVGTVLLWCAAVGLEPWTGQMGVLGIVPFVLFFGTGILSKEDLNNFLWTVVILAMGGLVLGEAVKTSGLLDVMAEAIADFIEQNNLSLWTTLCIFTTLIMICTTFVSHTVGAIVVIPIVSAVGSQMPGDDGPYAKVLVFASALACSAAMGLPVSGFPNMTAVGVEDHLGNRFLITKDFIMYAIPASVLALLLIVSVGYQLILLAVRIDDL